MGVVEADGGWVGTVLLGWGGVGVGELFIQ